jgi:hypothetical protein
MNLIYTLSYITFFEGWMMVYSYIYIFIAIITTGVRLVEGRKGLLQTTSCLCPQHLVGPADKE